MDKNNTKKTGKRFKDIFLFKIDKYSILAIILGIVINVILQKVASVLVLPLWLDSVGTIAVAIKYGPIAGIFTGVLTNLVLNIADPTYFSYAIISALVALIIGFYFNVKKKFEAIGVVSIALFSGLVAALASYPIDKINFNGMTGNKWGDAFYNMLEDRIGSSDLNIIFSKIFIEMPDKFISMILAIVLIRSIRNLVNDYNNKKLSGAGADKVASLVLVLGLVMSSFAMTTGKVAEAEERSVDYETEMFGSGEGLPTSEVNAVAQTRDGYIWAGTYSGLYYYNGVKFQQADIDDRIKNVMTLFVDSCGRLWIGTNDSGVFCYNPETRGCYNYNSENGLTGDSIRSICEDTEGNVYIGTVRYISRINTEGNIKTYSEWEDIFYAVSLTSLQTGEVVGVTNSGCLFLIKDDILLDARYFRGETGVYYRQVGVDGDALLVGTSSTSFDSYKVLPDGRGLSFQKTFHQSNTSYSNRILYYEMGYLICSEDGMGFWTPDYGYYFDMTGSDVKGSVNDVCVDDQDNIWFASNKYGLIKYSDSPFINIFRDYGIESEVVNAVLLDGNLLYVGTDDGLRVINLDTQILLTDPWISDIGSVRIRHIFKDSKGNFWISTYGENGLVKVDKNRKISYFNDKSGGMLGGRCRCVIELSDGRILAASNMGLTFIKDDKVVNTIGVENGLNNQYILSMYEKEDGTILAASDGDGIYIIRNDRVAGHIGKSEGLETVVVMKIVKCSDGFLYVTSNAIYHDNGKEIKALKHFPYSNNFDIIIDDNGTCFITSSAGLYVVNEETLLEDNEYTCTLLDESSGLKTNFTANSWNLFIGGYIILCCTDSVRLLSAEEFGGDAHSFQLHLDYIDTADGTIYEKDDEYVIPAGGGRVSFNIAVNNYSLSNPLVHYYLEGSDDEDGITCFQKEIIPLTFSSLAHGKYKLHIEVLDSVTGEITLEKSFTVIKKAMMYEKLYFQLYLYLLSVLVVVYIAWLFVTINKKTKRISGLQTEISTDPMTGILNKAGSFKTLEKLCAEENGIFMMIDLDSFKLINDIYGHDMGDKILIRFAELITQALGEGNMAGRIGGDEFTGFIKNTQSEEDVERITKFLNKELVKSAREYMGEDMNIPLGTSIGAVRVPADGRDFNELFKLADKALYVVKQNGKHSYSFYQKSGSQDLDKDKTDKNNLDQIKKIIGERNEGKGAYLVNFDKLQVIYKYLCREKNVNSSNAGILRFVITTVDGEDASDNILDSFEDNLVVGLKKNDVVSRYSGSFFVLCTNADRDEQYDTAERLVDNWKNSPENATYVVSYEAENIGE